MGRRNRAPCQGGGRGFESRRPLDGSPGQEGGRVGRDEHERAIPVGHRGDERVQLLPRECPGFGSRAGTHSDNELGSFSRLSNHLAATPSAAF